MKSDIRKTKKELIEELELLRKKITTTENTITTEIANNKALDCDELNILLNAAIELGSTLELQSVMQTSTDHITKLKGISTSAIYLVKGDELYLGATTPQLDSSMPEEFRYAKLDNHIHIKKVVGTKKIITVPDSKKEKFSPEEKIILEQRELRSIWYVPISISQKIIGVFIVSSGNKIKTCSEEELDLFRALSNIVAIALQNSLLHKELEEKNEELSTTLLSIGDAVISTDILGNVVLMNENAERLCGYKLKEVKGQPLIKIFNIINAKTRKKVENPVSKVIDDGMRVHLANHTILVSKDGKEYQISDSAAPIVDSSGEITGVVLVFSDVTNAYNLQEEVRRSKDNLVRAELMGGFGNWEIDLNKQKIYGSPGAANIYGVEGETFNIKDVQKLPLPEHRKQLDDLLYNLVNYNKPYNVEYKIRRLDGQIRTVHSTASYDAKCHKVFGILNDITERKEAEEALRKSEMKYREFFMKDLTGDFLSTTEGRVIDCNPAFVSILGYSSITEIQKYPVENFYAHPEEYKKLTKIIKQKREVTSYEIKMKNYDCKIITVLANVIGVFDKNDKLTHLRGYLFDVTDRKKAEDELIEAKEKAEAADRLKTEFLAQMSHEIRSPLNAVLSFAQIIREMTSSIKREELDTCFSGIGSASKRIIRTIDSILNMSELQLGTYQVVNRKIDIVDFLKSLLLEFENNANYKEIELRFKTNVKKEQILVDDYALGQIVVNLMDNAIKYTQNGFVEIQLSIIKNIVIKIKDTGIGISKEYLPSLFTPFSQEEQGYTRSFEGNGLGLALVKKYCEIIKADVSVESKKNVGTTFKIVLPK